MVQLKLIESKKHLTFAKKDTCSSSQWQLRNHVMEGKWHEKDMTSHERGKSRGQEGEKGLN